MRLDSPVVAFPAWLAPSRPARCAGGLAKSGRPQAPSSGSWLAQRRVALGLTQRAVADRLGICRETVARVENRPRYSRADARVTRSRARMNDLYLRLERAR